MNIINENERVLNVGLSQAGIIFSKLATPEDIFWPNEKWPRIKLDNRFEIGSKGGHGPIRYFVIDYQNSAFVKFKFTRPKSFNGFHQIHILSINEKQTQIKHVINMTVDFKGYILWMIGIKWLHEALIQDAFDKVQNHLEGSHKKTSWNLWVRILRFILN